MTGAPNSTASTNVSPTTTTLSFVLWDSTSKQHETMLPRNENKILVTPSITVTAGLLNPFRADTRLQHDRRTQLDRLYQRVADDHDALVRAVGLNLKAA